MVQAWPARALVWDPGQDPGLGPGQGPGLGPWPGPLVLGGAGRVFRRPCVSDKLFEVGAGQTSGTGEGSLVLTKQALAFTPVLVFPFTIQPSYY